MTPEEVGRVLDEIGERIGPAGEYAWTLTVRQVVIDAALWGALGLFCIALSVILAVVIRRSDRDSIARGDTGNVFGWGGLSAFVGLSLIPGLGLIVWPATMILNPEYHAMMRLIEGLVPR